VKLIFAAATGVRASEPHALGWRHIDFDWPRGQVRGRTDEDYTRLKRLLVGVWERLDALPDFGTAND
jgi:integrase